MSQATGPSCRPLPRRPTTRLLPALLALLVGVAVVLTTPRWVGNRENLRPPGPSVSADSVEVVVAVVDIPRGTTVTTDMVKTKSWPADGVPPGALTKLEDAVGRAALSRMVQGEPLTEHRLAPRGAGRGLPALIPPGMQAVTVQVPNVSVGVGGFVLPGNKVDVVLTVGEAFALRDAPFGGGTATTLLQRGEILAVDQRLDSPPESKFDPKEMRSVTLLVTPRQAAMVALGQKLGTLHLAPRGSARGRAPVPVVPTPDGPFKIDPNTPLKDLLPAAPKVRKTAGPVLAEDLARVPQVEFQAAPAKALPAADATRHTAHLIAKINHLNGKKPDGFLEALRGARPDLTGLPFVVGDACRTGGERSRQFALAVGSVRRALRSSGAPQATLRPGADRSAAKTFWREYRAACVREDERFGRAGEAPGEAVTLARIAALMQVLAPEGPGLRLGLVQYLATVSHVEATRALARLALFSPEGEVRRAAADALKSRREGDYTEILLRGLRYPWPAVARRAGEALARLGRTDLVPQLVALLGEPDPRAPVVQEINKKRVSVVRELVRINHHRSCLLCHAPGDRSSGAPGALTAAIPVPGTPLPSPAQGYRPSSPNLLVRFDVTYLRQDFSAYQGVRGAGPWPETQRFDFVTRTRVLTEGQAAAYREGLARGTRGRPSPYHQAVLAALRGLAVEGWRRLLGLPAPPRRDDPAPPRIFVPSGDPLPPDELPPNHLLAPAAPRRVRLYNGRLANVGS